MRTSYIELLGRNYPLCLSLSAAEELVNAFGSLDAMADLLDGQDISKMTKAVDTILSVLMKAGRIYAQALGEEVPPELPCRPADLIDVREQHAVQSIFNAMRSDTERTVEADIKNAGAAPAG